MSSTETSGAAPAEAAATTPAPVAAHVSFGSSRGSGLSRGKRPAPAGPSTAPASAPASDYRPTAIEVVQAPREYQNPFAPATPEPAVVTDAAPAPAVAEKVATPAPAVTAAPREMFPLDDATAATTAATDAEKAELNILEPAQAKTAPAQTWQSAGFKDDVSDRLAANDAPAAEEEFDASSIPSQFLYVRPGVNYVPTPRNWGSSVPRERRGDARPYEAKLADSAPAREPAAPASPGFFGWLKSLFGGSSSAPAPAESRSGEHRHHRRNRGGYGQHVQGDSAKSEFGGEHRGDRGGRRRRGGRDRGHHRSHGESQGSRQGGSI